MALLKLRDYQVTAIDAAWKSQDEEIGRYLVVLPTGAGKTVVFAHMCEQWVRTRRSVVLILVHRDELIRQTVEKLHSVAPQLRVGVVQASRAEVRDVDVIVASVPTLARAHRRAELPPIGLVVVDEAHHAVAPSYRAVLDHVGAVPVLGFTATPARGDAQGLGKVWERIVFTRSIEWMIAKGFLVDVRCLSVEVPGLDLSGVRSESGDLAAGGVADALRAANAGEKIAEAYVEHASDRQGAIFAPDVATARDFAESFKDKGIATEVVVGSTPIEERQLIYKRVRAGEVQVLSSAMVLTEGFDMPQLSCGVIARKTKSAPLFIQMVGRFLRPSHDTGKTDALILDVAGIAGKHRLASIADLTTDGVTPEPGESIGEAIIREAREAGRLDELKFKEISLFGASPVNWLRTRNGIRFVQTRNHTFFLLRNGDGTYRVGQCGASSTHGGFYHHDAITLEYGLSLVEQLAIDDDPSIASRDSAWRKGNRKPSPMQIEFATKLGIDPTELNKRDLSDAISVMLVSRLLDRKRKS